MAIGVERALGVAAAVLAASCAAVPDAPSPEPPAPIVLADISMSIAELETIRQANPDHVEVGLILGERYRQMGQLDDAEAAFRRVLDQAPGAADLQAGATGGLGLVAQSRDDLDAAEASFLDALRLSEAAGLEARAREQRTRLAVLERVRGDFVAACGWYARAGDAKAPLTAALDCGAPRPVIALAASIWRAHASADMAGLIVEARTTKTLAAEAEAAASRGEVKGADLAPVLGDYAQLVLYTEGAAPSEAVARRAIALDPKDGLLQLHLISPLILQDRIPEADAALEEVLKAWDSPSPTSQTPASVLRTEFRELKEADLERPHMTEILRRMGEHRFPRPK